MRSVALTNTDRILLSRCLANDPDAWRLFIDRFTGLFVHVVQHTSYSRSVRLVQEDIDDLCAEIFLALLADDSRILRKFRGNSSLVTYLGVISRRIAVREIIKKRKAEKNGFLNGIKSEEQPNRNLQQVEDQDEVQQMLKGLAYQDTEVVKLYYLQNKTYQEISDQLGIAINSIGSVLSRAKERMKKSQGKVSS